jgi:hypothetical protein
MLTFNVGAAGSGGSAVGILGQICILLCLVLMRFDTTQYAVCAVRMPSCLAAGTFNVSAVISPAPVPWGQSDTSPFFTHVFD